MIKKTEIKKRTSNFKIGQKVTTSKGEGIIHFIHPEGLFLCISFEKYKECFYPELVEVN